MKKLMILAVLMSFAVAYVSLAETTTTVTNRNQVIQIKTYDNMVTDTKNLDIYQDTSKYATKVGEEGTIVRWYDFDKMGGTASSYKLVPEVVVPHGAIITDGRVLTLTKMTPTTSTNSVGVMTATDIVASSTNFTYGTGLTATVPTGAVATDIAMTSNSYARIYSTGSAITAGKIMLVLKYIQGP